LTTAPETRRSAVIVISTHAEEDFRNLIAASLAIGFLPKWKLSARAIEDLLGDRAFLPRPISFLVRDIEPLSWRLLTKLLTDPAGQDSTNPFEPDECLCRGRTEQPPMSTRWTGPDRLDGRVPNLGSGRETGWRFESSRPHIVEENRRVLIAVVMRVSHPPQPVNVDF
jgi:hypothetical protein